MYVSTADHLGNKPIRQEVAFYCLPVRIGGLLACMHRSKLGLPVHLCHGEAVLLIRRRLGRRLDGWSGKKRVLLLVVVGCRHRSGLMHRLGGVDDGLVGGEHLRAGGRGA
eukprot:6573506-Prymnesium_polylepis.1